MYRNIKLLLFLASILCLIGLFIYNSNPNQKWIIHNIKYSFQGIIIEKVEVRKGVLSHAKIKIGQKDTLIFLNKVEMVSIGDSIKKFTNNPFYYYKHNGLWHKQVFEIISQDLQNSKNFPKDWKNKCDGEWKEACL
ncbi:hypothetical protein EG359_16455 [Chryseobacterium joostei]|uniref:6-phosphogluconate dehydrogenase n=1 Tax=Chryseobacterium joostei TaxID=112234 RepID=A0A1N7I9Y7_9FLAO|nr:hypothetical protein [Chryseobacterium joostei]AZB01110.1 hypothetical protein EG359_16455 [Chryseobacterium joostei]SIS33916.1 hypothetical protein SAMN05421768_103484 [Chryseobacterium joostei]